MCSTNSDCVFFWIHDIAHLAYGELMPMADDPPHQLEAIGTEHCLWSNLASLLRNCLMILTGQTVL